MSLAPRAVLVRRRSELDQLLDRYGTRGQVEFVLRSRGRTLEAVQAAHDAVQSARALLSWARPEGWRYAEVDRDDLPRFLFAPEDVVLVIGQDGLVANVAKYLDGQPVLGVDPTPGQNPGVLVNHAPMEGVARLEGLGERRVQIVERAMVALETDDGERILALNEVYVGHEGHQSARWTLHAGGRQEAQSCSGLLVGTGTGATGWCASLWHDRRPEWPLPTATERRLAWFVREAWASPVTGADLTGGLLDDGQRLELDIAGDRLVAFGDGIEADRLVLTYGQRVRVGVADRVFRQVA